MLDFHAGNLLVRLTADDHLRTLSTLHTLQLGEPLGGVPAGTPRHAESWFHLRVSRTDRLRFWQAYCKAARRVACPWRQTSSWPGSWNNLRGPRHSLLARRDRRCLFENRYFDAQHRVMP